MVVNNPNNWHWVEKNTLPWAQEYIAEELTKVKHTTDTHEIIVKSTVVSGDCDVSQRKGKVICMYDLNLEIALQGLSKEESKVDEKEEEQEQQQQQEVEDTGFEGKLTVSEFIHDERDYEFEFKELGKAKPIVQKEILPLILEVLYKFQDDLIKAHSKDVQE